MIVIRAAGAHAHTLGFFKLFQSHQTWNHNMDRLPSEWKGAFIISLCCCCCCCCAWFTNAQQSEWHHTPKYSLIRWVLIMSGDVPCVNVRQHLGTAVSGAACRHCGRGKTHRLSQWALTLTIISKAVEKALSLSLTFLSQCFLRLKWQMLPKGCVISAVTN